MGTKGTAEKGTSIVTLQKETRVFRAPKEVIKKSNVKKWMVAHGIESYEELLSRAKDLEWFWAERARDLVEWYKPYHNVLEWDCPYVKWFVGAKYNIVHDALDRHMKDGRKNKVAYIFEGEPGDVRKLTYNDLSREVSKLAQALEKLGIKKGDKVGIYLPMIPELPIAMLACAKIGAIHVVVFSGFSAGGLRHRIVDAKAKVLITCDSTYRRGKSILLKEEADKAVEGVSHVKHVIVYKRSGEKVPFNENRDKWWHEITKDCSPNFGTKKLDAQDLLYILYTSGTTGKPKGVVCAHGGYAVGVSSTLQWVFDIKDEDIYWCAADIGWVTGHSYIVYAPLILGATSVIYEGAPDYPQPDRWWSIIEKYGVTVLYTSPTAIRVHIGYGEEHAKNHDLSSLRLLGTVGETINPRVWLWYFENIGGGRCPVIDTWWQTETGSFVIAPLIIGPLKPGSVSRPLPGFSADVCDSKGVSISRVGDDLYLLRPWPAMLRGLYKDPEKYQRTYWSKLPEYYLTGDKARIDEDGFFWIQGRADDILKVAGHRIGNYEVESALISHPDVAEAAVIGKPHPIKGESISAYVVLRKDVQPSEELRGELRTHVAEQLGKIARPDEVKFVKNVPKTRSGKIMRRVVKAKVLGLPLGNTSTLMNPEAIEEIGRAV